ncbi:phosphoribosylpyrophosphate synthetase [Nonlabens sp. Ci31]|jgi:flagellar basal body rod protein FlgG|uniref:phosphoribosylpyrophosphate synthetase n=1 Tax=Nonlabens sp. Ci31 TaxID=2608253 RepID=UPI001462FB3D|nr:phosphoribosylpyrophosphate synthetase [Nonlabens sp. Ci31]QJP33168.1 phosphoribosylpyrophosphate synthetase [Nonlabens sp. Ci31]
MKKGYDTLSTAIEDLQSKGYNTNFDLVEDGVHSKDLKKQWKAGEIEVVQFYRFEGMSSAGDNSILYVLECKTGEKGLLVNAYGADQYISPVMIQKLQMK